MHETNSFSTYIVFLEKLLIKDQIRMWSHWMLMSVRSKERWTDSVIWDLPLCCKYRKGITECVARLLLWRETREKMSPPSRLCFYGTAGRVQHVLQLTAQNHAEKTAVSWEYAVRTCTVSIFVRDPRGLWKWDLPSKMSLFSEVWWTTIFSDTVN